MPDGYDRDGPVSDGKQAYACMRCGLADVYKVGGTIDSKANRALLPSICAVSRDAAKPCDTSRLLSEIVHFQRVGSRAVTSTSSRRALEPSAILHSCASPRLITRPPVVQSFPEQRELDGLPSKRGVLLAHHRAAFWLTSVT